jgi:predicted NUDIX family NTP pyrophosphohydrolase
MASRGAPGLRRARRSAGILLYRGSGSSLEVLVVHPGGPFWKRRDAGSWSIPKGECGPDEAPLDAARREFTEELGAPVPAGDPIDLGEVRLKSGKRIQAWALPGDLDATAITSNTFIVEWPPRSGQMQEFPEVDRAGWFSPEVAREKLNPAQAALVDRLVEALRS